MFRRLFGRKARAKPGKPTKCDDLLGMEVGPRPEGGCQQCLDAGDTWVHLRFCVTCNTIGCCEDSKNKHASKHAASSGHPVVRTREPGEDWAWCYEHDMGMNLMRGESPA